MDLHVEDPRQAHEQAIQTLLSYPLQKDGYNFFTLRVSDARNNLAAYTIVQAESHEAAAKIFENHPHFAIFPGDSVEIMECLPLPGQ